MKILSLFLVLVSFFIGMLPVEAKTYYNGPKGGCFYYGANYKKNYVSHSYCGR